MIDRELEEENQYSTERSLAAGAVASGLGHVHAALLLVAEKADLNIDSGQPDSGSIWTIISTKHFSFADLRYSNTISSVGRK